MSGLGSIGLAIYLSMSQEDPKNFYTRLGLLLGFGFLTGNTIGPLLDMVIAVEPQVVITALVGTAVVFVSLSCSALLAQRGSFLFLGGIAMSVLSTMALFGLINIFLQSYIVYQAHLYIGLVVMAVFVLFDTQMIMEKRRAGSTDCVKHSMDLFFDLISMFRRLLIILTQKVSLKAHRCPFSHTNVSFRLQEERQQRKRKAN